MVMGHASRIWRVRFLGDQCTPLDLSAISILSFGEDSTAQQWALQIVSSAQTSASRTQLSARLDHLRTFAFHTGKHIWSTALQRRDSSTAIIATGGADGKISMYEIKTSSCLTASESPLLDNTTLYSPGEKAASDNLSLGRSWELE